MTLLNLQITLLIMRTTTIVIITNKINKNLIKVRNSIINDFRNSIKKNNINYDIF